MSFIKVPDTSTDSSCRLDSPSDGEENDNISPGVHDHEIERDSIDNVVHDKAQDKMDQAPSHHDDRYNGNYSDPDQLSYDEANQEQLDEGPFNQHTDNDDNYLEEIVETYPKHVEPVYKRFKTPKPTSCYGDRWEERSPLPTLATRVQEHQRNPWMLQWDSVNDNEAAISSPASALPQMDWSHRSPSAVVARSSTFGRECKFYLIGKCRNGDLCPYQHTQHLPMPGAAASNADQDWQTSERPDFGIRDPPCKYYAEQGYCRRGFTCKFRHGNSGGDHPSFGPSGPESDDKGWSTGREEVNRINNNSNADVPAEDNDWGAGASKEPSKPEDHSAWDSAGRNDDSHKLRPRNPGICYKYIEGLCRRGNTCKFSHDQEFANKPLSSEAPKTDDGGWSPTDDSSHAPWNTVRRCPYHLRGNCRNGSFCYMSHWHWSENRSKVQDEDSQASHVLDNEATWSQSWPTEAIQSPSFSTKTNTPCKASRNSVLSSP